MDALELDTIHFLTKENHPMSWFSNFNGGKDVAYQVFSFASHKYFVYAINDDDVKGLQHYHQGCFQEGHHESEGGM